MDGVTVIGGGGGAGATTVVAELARALAALGCRAAVVDADLGGGDLNTRLGIDATPGLADVIAGRCAFDDVLHATASGAWAAAAGRLPGAAQPLTPDERLRLLQDLTARTREFDLLLIDAGTGVTPNTLFFASAARRVLLVTTAAVEIRHKAVAILAALSTKLPKTSVYVLVNRCRVPTDGPRTFADLVGASAPTLCADVHYLGMLPLGAHENGTAHLPAGSDSTAQPALETAAAAIAAELLRSVATAPNFGGGTCLLSR